MAYKYAAAIERAARRASKETGLPVKFVAGWRTRGRREFVSMQTHTMHHTAGPRRSRTRSDYPSFDVVKNGRAGLPGPLAGVGVGFSGTLIVFAAGVANHAGKSRALAYTNPYAFGNEVENSGSEKWTPEQYRMATAFARALVDELSTLGPEDVRAHHETCSPRGRKIDPNQISMSGLRSDVKAWRGKPTTTPAPEPVKKKGLFDMDIIATGRNTSNRIIKPGEKKRIPLGKYFSAATLKTGQTVRATFKLGITGAFENDHLDVSAKIVDHTPGGKPADVIVGNFYPDDLKGAAGGGWTDHVYVTQPYRVSQKPRTGGSLRLQLEVQNNTRNPITIRVTEFTVEGD